MGSRLAAIGGGAGGGLDDGQAGPLATQGALGLTGERPGKGVSQARYLVGAHVGPREGPFPQSCPLLLREPEEWAG